jgi:hypothetical protein
MRKLLTITLSIFLVLGLTSPVLAVNDTTGDNFVPDVDLVSASVVTSSQTNPANPPEVANIGITMAAGSHLPGLIIFDFDVDNDTATGTVGSLSAPLPTAEGGGTPPYKLGCNEGYDFFVVVALRNQSANSQLALSNGCFGSSTPCIERGDLCTGCAGGAEAYTIGPLCSGGAGCYNVITSVQTACNEGTCYQLNDPCPADQSCAMGLLRGEWYMATSLLKPPEVRGKNLLPFEYTILNETDICFTLPWAELIERAVAAGADLDEVEARNSPPQYQVSVWHDTAFIDEDDFSDEGGSPINLSDFLPNAGGNCNAAGEFNDNDPCFHNSAGPYGDLNVDALDVTDFLAEFGRSVFSRPCPNCKN